MWIWESSVISLNGPKRITDAIWKEKSTQTFGILDFWKQFCVQSELHIFVFFTYFISSWLFFLTWKKKKRQKINDEFLYLEFIVWIISLFLSMKLYEKYFVTHVKHVTFLTLQKYKEYIQLFINRMDNIV